MCAHLNKTLSIYYFRRPVPKDLIGHIKTKTGKPRTEWKISLRTKDREEAKRLLLPHEVRTNAIIDEARLTLAKQAQAPSAARKMPSSARQREWEDRDRQQYELSELADIETARLEFEREELEPLMDAIKSGNTPADCSPELLARAGYLLAQHERHMAAILVEEEAQKRVGMVRQVNASTAAEPANQLPALASAETSVAQAVSLTALYERYADSRQAKPKTVNRWRNRVAELVAFLGHDDASKVTRADLNRWTASLVETGLAKTTITRGRIPAIQVPFKLAFEDGLISANPAARLKVLAPKTVKLRDHDFTNEEALKILSATLEKHPAKLSAFNQLARRWVPWLCAYTGARVAEITQLRACDIQREDDIWFIHITPAAGSVKTGEARKVPLHSHLVEQGFTAFAEAGSEIPLFYQEGAGNENNPAPSLCASSLAKWVRTLGIKGPQPNHGWRHRFKTIARTVGMEEYVADKIQGHAPANQSRGYGQVTLSVMQAGIELLPRYEV
ncbi:MAG: DUF6538 domain-containing protein [Novosphingobium sp.]